jgi:NADH dehydrogenase [ubiquinone] 1 alpha subcomplex assembly factor 1
MFSFLRRTATVVGESSMKGKDLIVWLLNVKACDWHFPQSALRMEGIQGWQKELPMFTLNTPKDLQEWAIGCDKDIGGMNCGLCLFSKFFPLFSFAK